MGTRNADRLGWRASPEPCWRAPGCFFATALTLLATYDSDRARRDETIDGLDIHYSLFILGSVFDV